MKKIILLFLSFVILIQGSSLAAAPFAVPTFECLGIYWSPSSTDSLGCQVKYRKQGDVNWKPGFNLVYFNRTDAASYIGGKYRGSIVNLTPNTTYEISLRLSSGSDSATFTAKTWDENFPIGTITELPLTSSSMLNITTSGSPTAYRLYTKQSGSTATIDVNNTADNCVIVSGSYIIIRGLTLKNAKINGILLNNVHDVVIENCDISGWGRISSSYGGVELDGAIKSNSASLTRIIIQRNKLHHPRADANSWQEPSVNTHPMGPSTIAFIESDGNHVFRYNDIYSDANHRYNDALSGSSNNSYKGFPCRDTDIYGNYISFEWDDALELDGGSRNVRVWGNFIDTFACGISFAPCIIGPGYIWRNVSNYSNWGNDGSTNLSWPDGGPGEFFKGGNASDATLMGGTVYIFHNTILQPLGKYTPSCGVGRGIGNGFAPHVYTRNNILQMRLTSGSHQGASIEGDATGDFNYDLFNGTVSGPARAEMPYGIKGVPVYAVNSFDPVTKKGSFQLTSGTSGFDHGYPIPNFSDNFIGAAPDMGAQEAGDPPMEFGVNAYLGNTSIEHNSIPKASNSLLNNNLIISNIMTGKKSITFFVTLKNSGNWSLNVYNIIGKIIWEYKNKTTAGIYSVKYENAEIPQGQYFVKLIQDKSQVFSRFVVIK